MATSVRRARRAVHRRRTVTTVAAGGTAALLLTMVAVPNASAFAGSSLPGSTFEIDTNANLKVDDAGNIDWKSPGAGNTLNVKADKPTGNTDDSFGNGTKEDSAVPSVVDGSIPPNKSDLKSFGVLQEGSGSSAVLHMFWARVQNPSGTTNMDFEFNKSSTVSSNGVTKVRTAGDLLVTYDLSNGGTKPSLAKRTWTGTAWTDPADPLGVDAIGSVNTTAIAEADSLASVGPLSAFTFGEASINLATLLGTGTCASFGSAYLKSRSSDAFGSAVKDFIAPQAVNVSNCSGVSIHKTNEVGTALAGATFTLYTNALPLESRGAEDTATTLTCTTNASGDCTIGSVPFGSYWVVETGTPANHETAPDQAVVVAAGGNSPSGTLTFVDNRQQGSILVAKTGSGGAPLAGAGFTITPGSLAMTESSTGVFCTDGLLFGNYTVTESTVPAGYVGAAPQGAAVSSRSTCAERIAAQAVPDLTFVNSPAPGTINVAKTDDAATPNPLAGAKFTLFSDVGVVGTYEPLIDTTIAKAEKTTAADGTLSFTSVSLGNYCVVETFTPAGYKTAAPECVTVGLGSGTSGQVIDLDFVDQRQHKVIVLVCHEGTNTLDSASVSINGGTAKSSLGAPPAGLTEAQLCGLGGATQGGLDAGSHTAGISIS